MVSTDAEGDERFNSAVEKMPAQCEQLTNIVKTKDWKPLLAEAEERSTKVAEKIEAINKKRESPKKK